MTEEHSFVSFASEAHVGVVTLRRADSLNAISGAMADELTATLQDAAARDDIWVVVLAAAGEKAFCVGADLKERAGFSLDDFYDNRQKIRALFAALRRLPQPSIASVFGFALGGGFELALSCDLILAAEGAVMGLPEARVGLLPAGGGTQLLVRKAGPAQAKHLIFTGRRIDAREAAALGLVVDVVERPELEQATFALAHEICRSSPVAVREAKRSIDAGLGVPIDQGIEIENDAWATVISSDDRAEGIASFNDKRDPVWHNR